MYCQEAPESSVSKTPLAPVSFVFILQGLPLDGASTRAYLRWNIKLRIGEGKTIVFQAVLLLIVEAAMLVWPETLLVGSSLGSPVGRICTSKVSLPDPRCLIWTSTFVAFQLVALAGMLTANAPGLICWASRLAVVK